MGALKSFFDTVGGWVWGPPMLVLLVGTGIFLTLRLRLLQFTHLGFALRQAFTPHPKKDDGSDHEGDVSHFGALMTALSATIGTGNIAGVATAVVMGGPGAVFWMWMTAVFGMATKYAEGILAVKYRVQNSRGEMSGGPMYYIERGLGQKWLALLFALFGVLASFGIGSSCVLASTSGLTRRLTGARRPSAVATSLSTSSSASLSTLKQPMPACSACRISARVLPTPEKITLAGSPPAASTRCSSPPETMSKPQPARANTCSTASVELAFIA